MARGLSSWAPECGLTSCGAWAFLLCSVWDRPGSGMELLSPALAGGFFTTEPPGKPWMNIWWTKWTKLWVHSCCNSCLKTPSWALKPSCSSWWRKWTVIPQKWIWLLKKAQSHQEAERSTKVLARPEEPLGIANQVPWEGGKGDPVVLAVCWWGLCRRGVLQAFQQWLPWKIVSKAKPPFVCVWFFSGTFHKRQAQDLDY